MVGRDPMSRSLWTVGLMLLTACSRSIAVVPPPIVLPSGSARPAPEKAEASRSEKIGALGGLPTNRAGQPRVDLIWADSVLATLSLRDKAAQLVWPWILGDYVPEQSTDWSRLRAFVTEQHVGGIIISVGGPTDIATKTNALQRLSALPLLVSADLETGAGFRARGGYFIPNAIDLNGATNFPLPMALGAAGDTTLAYEMGRITAEESRALGIQIAFGPVLDVNNNPANPVIGARSFSENPQLASRMGVAMMRGLQEHGMLATGKHFPGHGDTETNSHLALASVNASRARLDTLELVPFRAVIDAGIGAIMTFHGLLPALDSSGVPATLSSPVMTALLRRELRFDGLLVSDAMDMAGVVQRFGATEAAKRAIAAGNDVLLMPSDIKGTIDAVVAGLAEGRYDVARLDQSVRRVLALKHTFRLNRVRQVDLDEVRRVVGSDANHATAALIAERAFVLGKDSLGLVPLGGNGTPTRLLSITYARRTDLSAGAAFNRELRSGVATLRSVYVNADESATNYDAIVREAASASAVVIGSYVNISSESSTSAASQDFVRFVEMLRLQGVPVLLVSFGSPYMLQQTPAVGTYAIAWGGSDASQRAAARALLGRSAISGRLPISIPPFLNYGVGLQRQARP